MSLDVCFVRECLPGRALRYFDTIDSTMHEAALLAEAGYRSGTAVVANHQSTGQGRHGHSWHSEKGAGLYVSVVLRPELPPESLPILTLALGLATAEAIARTTGLGCDLRWPNDVLLNGKKVAGVLVQLQEGAVIAGIGINVRQISFPPELQRTATSLWIESGLWHSREDMLVCLLQAVDSFCKMLVEAGREAILKLFSRSSSYVLDKRVTVEHGNRVLTGVTAGLDSCGFLKLQQDDGGETVIMAGGVRAA